MAGKVKKTLKIDGETFRSTGWISAQAGMHATSVCKKVKEPDCPPHKTLTKGNAHYYRDEDAQDIVEYIINTRGRPTKGGTRRKLPAGTSLVREPRGNAALNDTAVEEMGNRGNAVLAMTEALAVCGRVFSTPQIHDLVDVLLDPK